MIASRIERLANDPEVKARLAEIPRAHPRSAASRVDLRAIKSSPLIPLAELRREVEDLEERARLIERKRTALRKLRDTDCGPQLPLVLRDKMERALESAMPGVSLQLLRQKDRRGELVTMRFTAYQALFAAGFRPYTIGLFLNRDDGAVAHGLTVMRLRGKNS